MSTVAARARGLRGIAIVGLVVSSLLTACSSSGSGSAPDTGSNGSGTSGTGAPGSGAPLSADKIRLGIADTPEGALLLRVAEAEGYWKDQALTVDIQTVPTGPAQLAGLAGGSLDMAQSGPSTTMVPMQEGKASVVFIAPTFTALPWQLVISKKYADAHGITKDTDPEQVIPKMNGATFAGVSGPTDSISTVQGYIASNYGVTFKTDYLGSPAAMFAALSANRADAYIDVLGQSFTAEQKYGAVVVTLSDLKKLPYIADGGTSSFYTVSKKYAQEHPDTLKAFLVGMWKAWQFVADSSHHADVLAIVNKKYPGTLPEASEYFIKLFAERGMWLSQKFWQNNVDLANTTLKPPLTLTYEQATNPSFQEAAVAELGIKPPFSDQ